MAYNKNPESPEYNLTRWPAPDSNDLLPKGVVYTAFNEVTFELLKVNDSLEATMELLRGYQQEYPNSFFQSTYQFRFHPKPDTVRVYRNSLPLVEGEHYTVNENSRTITTFISPPGDGSVGILSCSYIPLDHEKRYPVLSYNDMRKEGLIIKRNTTQNLYDIINISRRSIEDMWKFLKKIPRTWTGGSNNQSMGFDNLLKFNTPISYHHFNQLGEEIHAINDYLGIELGTSTGVNGRIDVTPEEYITEGVLRSIMEDINALETLINDLLQDAINNNVTHILERFDL